VLVFLPASRRFHGGVRFVGFESGRLRHMLFKLDRYRRCPRSPSVRARRASGLERSRDLLGSHGHCGGIEGTRVFGDYFGVWGFLFRFWFWYWRRMFWYWRHGFWLRWLSRC
jgi:hypothetical protein